MKKLISLIGALFLGSVTFAQDNKTDVTDKTAGRKVLASDIKNLPSDTAAKSITVKGTVTQKGREGSRSPAEQQHYTIKLGNAEKSATGTDQKQTQTKQGKTEFLKIPTK